MSKNQFEHYFDLIGKNKTKDVLELLLQQFPEHQKELTLSKSRYFSNLKKYNDGLQNLQDYHVQETTINNGLLAFLDSLSKDNKTEAVGFLDDKEKETPASMDALLSNQMTYSQTTIKESKVFRTAVGVLFLVAIVCSCIVAFQYFEFLNEELDVIGILAANVLLYSAIGILSFYALSLIIKGGVYNQANLNFFKQILKK